MQQAIQKHLGKPAGSKKAADAAKDTKTDSATDGSEKGADAAKDTKTDSAVDGTAVPGEPWAVPLAPSNLDRTVEAEPHEEIEEEDVVTTREPRLPKFVGSTPLPEIPPQATFPPYGTFSVPTPAPEAEATMQPIKPQKTDANGTKAHQPFLDCLLADWGPWSACMDEAQGLPGQVQRRIREVLNSQHPGGQPCNATISTRRCLSLDEVEV